jgi:light-harvesting complex II chlorophyll a/b binding protein 5
MATIAAATAPAALSRSGRISRSRAFKVYALFSKKPAAPPAKAKAAAAAPIDEELAKWYGPDRRIYLPEGLLDRSEVPEYLNGEVPGE